MRWGAQSAKSSSLEWVRPLHAIVATFGPETEEPEIVPVAVDGVASGNTTYGHRFLSPAAITVRHFDDYVAKLEKAKVVLDPARRREIILNDAKNLAFAQGYELVEDESLLNEAAGLVEWPVVLMGTFDASFLKIPDEVIRATIRNNQKCFVVRDPKTGRLANRFILTANTEAADGGKAIIAGNERVIRARLSDAKFFYETDLKMRLEDRLPRFKDIIFHEKLGTQAERIQRIEKLAAELAPLVGADVEKAKLAALLCKTDLLTEVVGEFPEVQGTMGKYYALAQGEDPSVAAAIEEHYKPAGPNDRVPTDPVSIAVALADKLDIARRLLGDRREADREQGPVCVAPGGARRHPHRARQRAAPEAAQDHRRGFEKSGDRERLAVVLRRPPQGPAARPGRAPRSGRCGARACGRRQGRSAADRPPRRGAGQIPRNRRRQEPARRLQARDQHPAHRGEEGRHDLSRQAGPAPLPAERGARARFRASMPSRRKPPRRSRREDFERAMAVIARLRPHVDAFFDKVTVNVPAADRRENRLKLLNEIREATGAVADFSRIEG